jgi:glycosyltransferase involved in cell wall biosynthesis
MCLSEQSDRRGKERQMDRSEPIRVLHVLGGVGPGGAESRIMDLYRQMDREKIQFDFLVHSSRIRKAGDDPSLRKPEFFDEEIRQLGGKIYVLPKFKVYNYFTYRRAITRFFREHHEFRVVQGHMTSTAGIYLPIAKKCGVPVTVAHSRNAGVEKGLKGLATRFFRRNLADKADYLFACSALAGEDVFGRRAMDEKRVRIIHNAIDVRKFEYDPAVREQMRQEYGVEDKLVLGHVGRFNYQKNHPFLIEVFAQVCSRRNDAVLILVGDGPDRAAMEEKCSALGISDKVLFVGNQREPWKFYQAFDIFLLPSFFEGLPGVLVEAQAAGLLCFVSDAVTREAQATENVHYLDIHSAAESWATEILKRADYQRRSTCQIMQEAGFDVTLQAEGYRNFYENGDISRL